MDDTRYRLNAGIVYALKYHMVWCPNYRLKVLVGEIEEELRTLLYQKARAFEIKPDHVHLFVQIDPSETP